MITMVNSSKCMLWSQVLQLQNWVGFLCIDMLYNTNTIKQDLITQK